MSDPLILILDDSELVASMLEMICGQLGYRTSTALLFEQVQPLIVQERPSVILSDVNLPDLPADDPVSALRAIPALADIPIILISGQSQDALDALATARGAQAAVSKDAGLPGMAAALAPTLARLAPR